MTKAVQMARVRAICTGRSRWGEVENLVMVREAVEAGADITSCSTTYVHGRDAGKRSASLDGRRRNVRGNVTRKISEGEQVSAWITFPAAR